MIRSYLCKLLLLYSLKDIWIV